MAGRAARIDPRHRARKLLDVNGIDALDIMLSPLYLAILNSLRKRLDSTKPAIARLVNVARNWAFQQKVAYWERLAAWKSTPAAPTDVVLWSRNVTHTAILEPVAAAHQRRHSLPDDGLPTQDLHAFASARIGRGIHARLLAARSGVRAAMAMRVKRFLSLGPWQVPPFPGASSETMAGAATRTVMKHLRQVVESIANARMTIETFQPKVLVVGNDLTVEGRAGCRVATMRGVPTGLFMHGSITGDVLQALHCADRIMVYGSVHRRELIEQGVAPDRIVVCGRTNLDSLAGQAKQVHPVLQARLQLRADDPWILVATSGPGHRISHAHHQLVIQNLMRLSAAHA